MIDQRKTATKLKDRKGIYQTVTEIESRQEINKESFLQTGLQRYN